VRPSGSGYPKTAEALCSELNDHQVQNLIDHAISLHEAAQEHDADMISLILTAFTSADIKRLHMYLVSIGRFYPGVIFHGASDEVEESLIEAVGQFSKDTLQLNHLLQSLAWSGSERVVSLFMEWRRTIPKWSSRLHIKPEEYSREAGWELDGKDRRRLYFNDCHALEKKSDTSISSVTVVSTHSDKCRWCERPMTTLFDMDLSGPVLSFIKCDLRRLSIAACDSCANYGPFFSRINKNGKSSWHDGNIRPEHLPDGAIAWPQMPENMLAIVQTPRRPLLAAHQNLPTTFSQIGGHPTWIQDAEYPSCPDCKKTMMFVAQLSVEDIEPAEGIYYAFVCFDCLNGATTYQQT
jgi:hypothetical protein